MKNVPQIKVFWIGAGTGLAVAPVVYIIETAITVGITKLPGNGIMTIAMLITSLFVGLFTLSLKPLELKTESDHEPSRSRS